MATFASPIAMPRARSAMATTPTSKWMPVDAETVDPEDELFEPRSGHVSHFSTCDDPERFRREGRGG